MEPGARISGNHIGPLVEILDFFSQSEPNEAARGVRLLETMYVTALSDRAQRPGDYIHAREFLDSVDSLIYELDRYNRIRADRQNLIYRNAFNSVEDFRFSDDFEESFEQMRRQTSTALQRARERTYVH